MPYSISTSRFSFVQWEENDFIVECEFTSQEMCLPVHDTNDVWFQFTLEGETQEEADVLCAQGGEEPVVLGLVENCGDAYRLQFEEKPTRYRISPTKVLYVWQQGLPNFQNSISVGMCFRIMVSMPSINDQSWCSNCFQRIADDCHTSVIEYGNDENAFDFNYCAGEDLGDDSAECEPLFLEFTNQTNLTIPWTAFLEARYGTTPSVEVWIYEEGTGELIKPGVLVKLDTYPPTEIRIDLGGTASGVVKIM